jgi:AcrR family transcriptional regulator
MGTRPAVAPPSRGHKKKQRTRRQLLDAGVRALAEKGEAFTVSDVVASAELSNGTFYNYFSDRDALIDALAEDSLTSLAARSAVDTAEQDPAHRLAFASARVLARASEDPTWGRAILRLADHRRSPSGALFRYLREDLATGLARGRFAFGDDDITLDSITGLLLLSLRRIVRGESAPDHVERVLERALTMLGVERGEAARLAAEAASESAGRPRAATPSTAT